MLFICQSLGLDGKKIDKCMGDPKANSDNPVLKEEQDAQVIVVLFFSLQLSMTLLRDRLGTRSNRCSQKF
jgi:hypothetical protein